MLKKLIVGAVSAASFAAFAQGGDYQKNYFEVGYTALKSDAGGVNFSPTALRAVVGTGLTDNLAFEAMILTGLSDDVRSASGGGISASARVKLGFSAGVFLKPHLKLGASNEHELFGRVGYFSGKGEASGTAIVNGSRYTLNDSGSQSDIAFGGGAKFGVSKDSHVTFDYMRYIDKNGFKLDGVTVGFSKQF